MKRILMLGVTSQSIYNFRCPLIRKLESAGYEVIVSAFDDQYAALLKEQNVHYIPMNSSNRSVNVFKNFSLLRQYRRLIREIRPDIVFTFMLKPNVFGVSTAHKAGVRKIYAMVEGAGDVFIRNTLKWKIIRRIVCHLYKKAFRRADTVFFLNDDDKDEFVARKLVKAEQCSVLYGIGVDLTHFACTPLQSGNTFLMVARMLQTKGVMEYCACARLVRQTHPEAVFNYLGAEGNVTLADIDEYIKDGSVHYLGTASDVRPYLEAATCMVLPSYREGFPMSVMEAEAAGRCVIANNCVGCKDAVREGYNGFLIDHNDVRSFAEKCIYILEHPDEAALMGQNARRFAEEHFDSDKINDKVFRIMEAAGARLPAPQTHKEQEE